MERQKTSGSRRRVEGRTAARIAAVKALAKNDRRLALYYLRLASSLPKETTCFIDAEGKLV